MNAAFFQPGRLYQHPSEGVLLVAHVGTAPAPFEHHMETLGVAFGWRWDVSPNGITEGLGSYTTPDFFGWEPLDDAHEEPFGCLWCGDAQHHHGHQRHPVVGMHQWERPAEVQVKARMRARRAPDTDVHRAEVLAEAAQTEITPPDNDTVARRAHLAHAIGRGGRWKSGTVVRWYEANGYTGCTVHTTREDLVALASAGVAVQHDEPGVRYYTAAREGGDRRG
jgi:hypothetical protein